MKYSRFVGRSTEPPPGRGPADPGVSASGSPALVEPSIGGVDPRWLAEVLDQLSHEVLDAHRPPQEAWEELRRLLLSKTRH